MCAHWLTCLLSYLLTTSFFLTFFVSNFFSCVFSWKARDAVPYLRIQVLDLRWCRCRVFPLEELRDIEVPSSSPISDMPCNIIEWTSSPKQKSPKWIAQKCQYRVGKLLQRGGRYSNIRVSLFQPINFPYLWSDSQRKNLYAHAYLSGQVRRSIFPYSSLVLLLHRWISPSK